MNCYIGFYTTYTKIKINEHPCDDTGIQFIFGTVERTLFLLIPFPVLVVYEVYVVYKCR